MTTTKADFFNELYNNISEPLYLTIKTDEINEEVHNNLWILDIPEDIIYQITTTDILDFIYKVTANYKNQLDNSQLDIDLIFYLWCDEMAGQIRFNFINANHENLPFNCKIKQTDRPEIVIEQYLKSRYRNGIPWQELEIIESSESLEEGHKINSEIPDDFELTVYHKVLKKQK